MCSQVENHWPNPNSLFCIEKLACPKSRGHRKEDWNENPVLLIPRTMSFSKRNRLEKPSLPGERHLAIGAHRFLDDGVCTMRVEEWAPGDVKEQGSKKSWRPGTKVSHQHHSSAKDGHCQSRRRYQYSLKKWAKDFALFLRKKMCGWLSLRVRSVQPSARTTIARLPEMALFSALNT